MRLGGCSFTFPMRRSPRDANFEKQDDQDGTDNDGETPEALRRLVTAIRNLGRMTGHVHGVQVGKLEARSAAESFARTSLRVSRFAVGGRSPSQCLFVPVRVTRQHVCAGKHRSQPLEIHDRGHFATPKRDFRLSRPLLSSVDTMDFTARSV